MEQLQAAFQSPAHGHRSPTPAIRVFPPAAILAPPRDGGALL